MKSSEKQFHRQTKKHSTDDTVINSTQLTRTVTADSCFFFSSSLLLNEEEKDEEEEEDV